MKTSMIHVFGFLVVVASLPGCASKTNTDDRTASAETSSTPDANATANPPSPADDSPTASTGASGTTSFISATVATGDSSGSNASGTTADGSGTSPSTTANASGSTVTALAPVLVNSTPIPSGDATCTAGGTLVTTFIDANNNGVMDSGEKLNSYSVCNGTPGASAVVLQNAIAVGSNACPAGGLQIITFTDVNGNGTYEAGTDTGYQSTTSCNTLVQLFTTDQQAISLADTVRAQAVYNFQLAQNNDASAAAASGTTQSQLTAAQNQLTFDTGVDNAAGSAVTLDQASVAAAQAILTAANTKLNTDISNLAVLAASINTTSLNPDAATSLTTAKGLAALIKAATGGAAIATAKLATDVANWGTISAQQLLVQADSTALGGVSSVSMVDNAALQVALVNYNTDLTASIAGQPNTLATTQAAVKAAYAAIATDNGNEQTDDRAFNADSNHLNTSLADNANLLRANALLLFLTNYRGVSGQIVLDNQAVCVATAKLQNAHNQLIADQAIQASDDQTVVGDSSTVSTLSNQVAQNQSTLSADNQAEAIAQSVVSQASAAAAAAAAQLQSDVTAFQAATHQLVSAMLADYQAAATAAIGGS